MTQVSIPLEFVSLMIQLVRTWFAKYEIHPDDIDLFELIVSGIHGGAPPTDTRKGMGRETDERQYELDFRRMA